VRPERPLLGALGGSATHPAVARMLAALRGIEVHSPFQVAGRGVVPQRAGAPGPTARLECEPTPSPAANDLANCYYALARRYGRRHWQETLEQVQAGIGPDLEAVETSLDADAGIATLALRYANVENPIPAGALSDGTLAFLYFVALERLGAGRTLLAFDEPDVHLHPEMLPRVLALFESMARERPVLLATHSDRLLDALTDPSRALVLCELDERRATRLIRPDPEALERWLQTYRGVGELRTGGLEEMVMTRVEEDEVELPAVPGSRR
jgi:predicted ATPase